MKPLLSYEKIKEYVKRTHTKRIRPLNRVEKSRGEYYLPPPHPFFLPPFFLPPFLQAIVLTSFHYNLNYLATLVITNLLFMFSRVFVDMKSTLSLNLPDVIGNVIAPGTPGVKLVEV